MTRDEIIERNIGLTFDFIREVVKTPSLLNDLDDDCLIEFVEKDVPLTVKPLVQVPDKYFKVRHRFEKV